MLEGFLEQAVRMAVPEAQPERKQGEGAVKGQPLHTAAAWTAAEALAEAEAWQTQLSAAEVEEVLQATRHAVATGKPIQVGALCYFWY